MPRPPTRRAATNVEYAILAALIAAGIVAAVAKTGTKVSCLYGAASCGVQTGQTYSVCWDAHKTANPSCGTPPAPPPPPPPPPPCTCWGNFAPYYTPDWWCEANCFHNPSFCPPSHCQCDPGCP